CGVCGRAADFAGTVCIDEAAFRSWRRRFNESPAFIVPWHEPRRHCTRMSRMETVKLDVRRVGTPGDDYGDPPRSVSDLEADLARARWLAKLLDAQFSVAGIEFGLDAIVGLVPVAGDLIT